MKTCVLARQLEADTLIILTAVEKVAVHFGKPEQKWLDVLTPEEAEAYMAEGHFAGIRICSQALNAVWPGFLPPCPVKKP